MILNREIHRSEGNRGKATSGGGHGDGGDCCIDAREATFEGESLWLPTRMRAFLSSVSLSVSRIDTDSCLIPLHSIIVYRTRSPSIPCSRYRRGFERNGFLLLHCPGQRTLAAVSSVPCDGSGLLSMALSLIKWDGVSRFLSQLVIRFPPEGRPCRGCLGAALLHACMNAHVYYFIITHRRLKYGCVCKLIIQVRSEGEISLLWWRAEKCRHFE